MSAAQRWREAFDEQASSRAETVSRSERQTATRVDRNVGAGLATTGAVGRRG